jgi:hypothetical protein
MIQRENTNKSHSREQNTMKTVVYQSYRTTNVPKWISICMETVREWAAKQGYDYKFYDDGFFGFAPDWYRERVSNDKCLVTDLSRLIAAKDLLSSGYERTIWVDIDIIIWDSANFIIEVVKQYAFCREIWTYASRCGGLGSISQVNNSISVFVKENTFLDFYIEACQMIVKNIEGEIKFLEVGTKFLSGLYKVLPFQTLSNIAVFSPVIIQAIADEYKKYLIQFMRQQKSKLYAANLCSSLITKGILSKYKNCRVIKMTDDLYLDVINRLLQTKGNNINKYF